MKLTHKQQQEYFDSGYTLIGEDGIKKKILPAIPGRFFASLGFCNLNGTWFYGAGFFPEDEELDIKLEIEK